MTKSLLRGDGRVKQIGCFDTELSSSRRRFPGKTGHGCLCLAARDPTRRNMGLHSWLHAQPVSNALISKRLATPTVTHFLRPRSSLPREFPLRRRRTSGGDGLVPLVRSCSNQDKLNACNGGMKADGKRHHRIACGDHFCKEKSVRDR